MDHYVLGFQNASYFYFRLYYDYKYLIRSDIADFLCGLFNRWDDDKERVGKKLDIHFLLEIIYFDHHPIC